MRCIKARNSEGTFSKSLKSAIYLKKLVRRPSSVMCTGWGPAGAGVLVAVVPAVGVAVAVPGLQVALQAVTARKLPGAGAGAGAGAGVRAMRST